MCKVVKWKYSSHIIYELCFHLAFGCLDICLVRVKKSGSLTECPTAYKSIASFFSQSPSSPAYAFDSKRKYFCMRHWTCSVFSLWWIFANVFFFVQSENDAKIDALYTICAVLTGWRQDHKNDSRRNIMNKCVLWDQPWSESLFVCVLLLHLNSFSPHHVSLCSLCNFCSPRAQSEMIIFSVGTHHFVLFNRFAFFCHHQKLFTLSSYPTVCGRS